MTQDEFKTLVGIGAGILFICCLIAESNNPKVNKDTIERIRELKTERLEHEAEQRRIKNYIDNL